jgi:hypothetical protein
LLFLILYEAFTSFREKDSIAWILQWYTGTKQTSVGKGNWNLINIDNTTLQLCLKTPHCTTSTTTTSAAAATTTHYQI